MISLGLDPSLTGYGWAVFNSEKQGRDRRVASGHESTKSTSVPVTRYIHFRDLVRKLIGIFNPDILGIESPAFESGPFQTIHYSLMMFSLESIFLARKDVVLYDPATLKLLARGSLNRTGLMTKLDMQRFVSLDTNDPDLIDNNEADAYIIAYFASRFKSLTDGILEPNDLTATESRVFLEKTKKVKTLKGHKIKNISHIYRENNRYFKFSNIPLDSILLPVKESIRPELLNYLKNK